jgi:RNA recognition motif-containing protein
MAETLTPPSPCRVFISNISEHVSEEMVKSIFEAFGEVKACALAVSII